MPTSIDVSPVDARRKANRARLIQQVDEIDPLQCANCSNTMRIIAMNNAPPFAEFSLSDEFPEMACCVEKLCFRSR